MVEHAEGMQVTPSIRLKRRLGAGGMGAVWVAEHAGLATDVVVKFLADRLSEDPTSQARFTREAAAAAQVRSPHVVQMLDHGVMDDGQPFIVMELLEGHDLAKELSQRKTLPPAEVAHVVEHVALALQRAHMKGIVHRDIKPNNIFLCDVGAAMPFVKLLDFGIAREASQQHLTATGNLVGTPAFMSPEQLSGRDVGAASDLWSLGMVAFRALTGVTPFERPTAQETMGAVLYGELPVPSHHQSELTRAIDAWFARACCKDPGGRFASAAELSEALWHALGISKTVVSSPVANAAPLGASSELTVPIGPTDPNTEGTLRSTVGSGSLVEARRAHRRRWPWVAAGLGLAAATATFVATERNAAGPLPLLSAGSVAVSRAVHSAAALATPPAAPAPTAEAQAPAPPAAPAADIKPKAPVHRPAARPVKPDEDDGLGF